MKATNPSHALAITLIDELARCGVEHACLAPGSRSAALAMALAEDPRITLHVCIDERSASFMALGIGRATRRPSIILSTSGTAAANFHPAVIEAEASRVPLLVLTADRPPELRSTGTNQTIDQLKLYGDSVRWFCELGTPEESAGAPRYWRSVACRAFAESIGGPAGPVHINLAMREPLVPHGGGYAYDLDGRAHGAPWTHVSQGVRIPAASDVGRLVEVIASAERPLLVAGEGVSDPDTIVRFAADAGVPLIAEPLSMARRGPNAITTYDALLRTEWAERHRPDLVIRIGRIATSKMLAQVLATEVQQVLLDDDGWWLDPARTTSWMIAADVAETLDRTGAVLASHESTRWLESWRAAEQRARAALDAFLDDEDRPNEPRAARDLAALIPDGANLVAASSMPVRDLDWFMGPRGGIGIYGNRGASGIDGFVSTTVGVAIASGRSTYALAGDLSLLHDQNGLIGARSWDAHVTFVVLNNDGGGIFSFLPQAEYPENFERLFGTPHGLDLGRLAGLYDIDYRLVERAGDLADALAGDGIRLVEVRTDRAANVEVHERAWEAVRAAL